MEKYSIERERRLKEKERQEYTTKLYACYNEELDLWNTGLLRKLEEERREKELTESLGRCKK